jgi:hypothetical protein
MKKNYLKVIFYCWKEWLGLLTLIVFVNRKTDHFNHEKPSTWVVCTLKIHNEKPSSGKNGLA